MHAKILYDAFSDMRSDHRAKQPTTLAPCAQLEAVVLEKNG